MNKLHKNILALSALVFCGVLLQSYTLYPQKIHASFIYNAPKIEIIDDEVKNTADVLIELPFGTDHTKISKVEYFANDRLIGEVKERPWSMIWSNVIDGEYTVEMRVTDDLGLVSDSEEKSFLLKNIRSVFYKGVNLGSFLGNDSVIKGNRWTDQINLQNKGELVVKGGVTYVNTDIEPSPSVDQATKEMLNSAIVWSDRDTYRNGIGIKVDRGEYNVFLWLLENYADNSRSFGLGLEDSVTVISNYDMMKGEWRKIGPIKVYVRDEVLDIDIKDKMAVGPHLMGIEIYKIENGKSNVKEKYEEEKSEDKNKASVIDSRLDSGYTTAVTFVALFALGLFSIWLFRSERP